MNEPNELWLRLGCSIQLTDEEAKYLLGTPHGYEDPLLEALFRKLIREGKASFCGDCVIRPEDIEAFNLEYGTDYPEEEIAFYI